MANNPQQESFQSMATVFILQEKTWIERGSGLVRFVFDLRTFALRLVIRPGTPDEFECKLRPRIRSKGPRAYVVRAQADNGNDEHILAVRFEREEDSRSFRRFVEKRDVDHNKNNSQSNPNMAGPSPQYTSPHLRNTTDYSNQSGANSLAFQGRNSQTQNMGAHPSGNYGSYASTAHALRGSNMYNSNTALSMYTTPSNTNIAVNPNNMGGMAPSPSNPSKAPPHHPQSNYFWTCSRCLQMVDPSLSACHVCGKVRDASANAAASGMQPHYEQQQQQQGGSAQNMMNPMGAYGHPHQNMAAAYGQPGPPHQNGVLHQQAPYGSHHQINASAMPPSNHRMPQQPQPQQQPHYAPHTGQHAQASMPPNGIPPHSEEGGRYVQHSKSYAKHTNSHKTVPIYKLTTVNLDKHNKLFPAKRRAVKEIITTQLEWLRTHQ
eukprot:CAMPEP_0202696800 /NCGR_PEP_ID=MMETSP1385-20130828/10124_1 /ASSEMBLY_ACC=CAM_ASM_000861 /TAXON_ID=933848 /ORGANISM="Elphidium margaritaceum" /LENGTH=433 /DNA_ID=CAMNT_0049353089 /DNA_START=298 /DNA_END=1599 /DNA_ORIENTATION=+